jgi:hypothetical protein
MTISELHGRLSNTALLFFFFLSIWGYWRFFRKQGVDASYWGALAIGELLLLVQSGLGAYLWVIGLRPERGIHLLYGIVALLAIPAAYAYTKGQDTRADILIHGTTTLITVGLIFRAISTALPG